MSMTKEEIEESLEDAKGIASWVDDGGEDYIPRMTKIARALLHLNARVAELEARLGAAMELLIEETSRSWYPSRPDDYQAIAEKKIDGRIDSILAERKRDKNPKNGKENS